MTGERPCRSLVIGDLEDLHVRAVIDQCSTTEGLVILNAATLPETMHSLDAVATHVRDVEGSLCTLSEGVHTNGWIRRLAPEDWDLDTVMGSRRAAVMASRLTLLGAIMRDPAVHWLTGVEPLFSAENKVLQLRTAITQGLRIPITVITRDLARLAEDLTEPFVLKPLGPGHFLDIDGQMQVIHATETTTDRLAGVDLLDAPFLAQQRIQARRHVRIVTVGDRAWPCSLDATGLPLDWRQDVAAHNNFQPDPSMRSLVDAALALADALHCGYSSQDWLIDDDGPVFLDLNPGGQWLFLPTDVAEQVTQAIASWVDGQACAS